ncbi:hypothetical protein C5167_000867 [Papaver somniferum]|uniref:Uncharacterized protein n=1 Tax=Papaver somniferum TaxID=3469 RepID=A0A4Y7KTR6_PAPSO|nr:hypothetical protein C5167_000867 [Papaver somniferum]
MKSSKKQMALSSLVQI